MPHKLRGGSLSTIIKAVCLLVIFLSYPLIPQAKSSSNVFCRPDLAVERRNELANKLRAITGWNDLNFDDNGALRLGKATYSGGSETARNLLAAAEVGEKMIVMEDASNRNDVVFCHVVEARWTNETAGDPPAYVVLIDFADFSRVTGDKAALAAFNTGWAVLHEINHVVHNSVDASEEGQAGECEELINRMRRECGLAERAEYHFTFFPGAKDSNLTLKLVRLAFEQREPDSKKKKRYWLLWDANLVGGLNEPKFSAHR